MSYQRAETAVTLAGVERSRAFFAPCLAGSGRDSLWVAHVDEQARCIHLAGYQAGERQTGLPIQEIIRDAAQLGSAGVVLAHRQQDSAAAPLQEAASRTAALATAAGALNITVLDHLVLSGVACSSLRRLGLL